MLSEVVASVLRVPGTVGGGTRAAHPRTLTPTAHRLMPRHWSRDRRGADVGCQFCARLDGCIRPAYRPPTHEADRVHVYVSALSDVRSECCRFSG